MWRAWSRCLSSTVLYGHTKLQLPFTSLTEECRVTRVREVLLYRDSTDTKVSSAGVTVGGKRWWAHEAVKQAEARLRHGILENSVAAGRAG